MLPHRRLRPAPPFSACCGRSPGARPIVSAAADNIRDLIAAAQRCARPCLRPRSRRGGQRAGAARASDAPVTPLGDAPPPAPFARPVAATTCPPTTCASCSRASRTRDACVREIAVPPARHPGGDEVGPGLLQRPRVTRFRDAERRRARPRPRRDATRRWIPSSARSRDPSTGTKAERDLGARPHGATAAPCRPVIDGARRQRRRSCARPPPARSATSTRPAPSPPCFGFSRPIPSPRCGARPRGRSGSSRPTNAADALAAALRADKDAEVSEMCAWALGEMDTKRGADALLAAAKGRSANDSVRETAVWALGEHGDARPRRARRARWPWRRTPMCAAPPRGRWGSST